MELILSQLNSVHAITLFLLRFILILFPHLCPVSLQVFNQKISIKQFLSHFRMLFFFRLKRQTCSFIHFKLSCFQIEFCRIKVSEVKGKKNFYLVCSHSYKKSSVQRPPFLFCLQRLCPLDTCITVSSSLCNLYITFFTK
jgi:hypothetical protein